MSAFDDDANEDHGRLRVELESESDSPPYIEHFEDSYIDRVKAGEISLDEALQRIYEAFHVPIGVRRHMMRHLMVEVEGGETEEEEEDVAAVVG